MTQFNDAWYAAVNVTNLALADEYYNWLGANGGIGNSIPDREYSMLLSQGAAQGMVGDMWFQVLGTAGYLGSLVDRLYDFWVAGGVLGAVNIADLSQDFSPLEASPDWTAIEAGPSNWDINGGQIRSLGSTSPETSVRFRDLDLVDVTVVLKNTPGNQLNSLPSFWTVRMQDADNFVGFRFFSNRMQIYQRIAGSFTQLDGNQIITTVPATELRVTFNGAKISVDYDGDLFPEGDFTDTAVLASGFTGIVARGDSAGAFGLTDYYEIIDNS